ncbi:MAG TPA: SRPBCC family protein [Vicinamibacterales bacterium]|jgi:uncharacterized protein YndB with AHSA1/START domain
MDGDVVGTDRIEKRIVLRAPRSRVWRALSNAAEFGSWFGVDFGGLSFAPGASVRGRITYPGYEHLTLEVWIEEMEPERVFSFRWHPHAVDPGVDYSKEPTTLVTFELQEVAHGTQLTVVESGFDAIPIHRRAQTLRMNENGWTEQVRNIDAYVTHRE